MTETEQPKRKRGRGLKWAFGLSLALNLVFIGLFAGAALRFSGGDKGWRGAPPHVQSYGAPFVRALPRDGQRELRRALRETAGGLPSREERRALYAQLIAEMRAETFDADAVKQLFSVQSEGAQQVMATAQSAWLAQVSEMSTSERAAVADRLEKMLNRRKGKGPKRP